MDKLNKNFAMDLQLFAEGKTKMEDMVDPEVLADMINAELEDAIRFRPLAEVDRTLEGRPGSTITVPKFKYIGPAEDVAEGEAIDITKLESDTEDFTIKKAGKGVEITDEAVLSGYGDPIQEAGNQIIMSIAEKVDDDCLDALLGTPLVYENGTDWDLDTISDALDLFEDEEDEDKVLILHPKDASELRKAVGGNWERSSDLGDRIIVEGTYGGVLDCQVVRSRKMDEGVGVIVKAGALRIYLKREAEVETDRDILTKSTVMTGDQHYGAHLYDESRALKIDVTE